VIALCSELAENVRVETKENTHKNQNSGNGKENRELEGKSSRRKKVLQRLKQIQKFI